MKWLKASDQIWWYKPTKEDKANIQRKPWYFKLSWDGVFHTIQWEWQFAWRPTVFIRLHLCNLQCAWCDAWYTRKTDTKEYYQEPQDISIDELYEKIKEVWWSCRDITFTWWEPLLQQWYILTFLDLYWDEFDRIQIETNWTIPPVQWLEKNPKVYFNCSPKLSMSWNDYKMRYRENILKLLQDTNRSIFKFVFKNIKDIDEITIAYPFLKTENIRLMPEWVLVEEHRAVFDKTIDFILKTWYNVAVRTQSIMRDWAKRWV